MTHTLYKTKEEIENWLIQNKINNFEIVYVYDFMHKENKYMVNVNTDVNLYGQNLTEIPIKFNIVLGNFNCGDNKLTSLYGSPNIVKGNFSCHRNEITSLRYCPEIKNGSLNCHTNKIKSLKYIPSDLYNLKANNNSITSLKYCPELRGSLWLNNNNIKNINTNPNNIGGWIYLKNNPICINEKISFEELKNIYKNELRKKLMKSINEDISNLIDKNNIIIKNKI